MEPYGLKITDSVKSAHTLFRLFIDYYFWSIIIFIVSYLYSFLELLFLRLFFFLLFFFFSVLPLFSYNS